MEQYSRLSELEIKRVLSNYGIHEVRSSELLKGGAENTNYLICSELGKHIFCICEQKSEESAKALASLLEYLASKNFKTSRIVYTKEKNSVLIYKNKPCMLRTYLEGDVVKNFGPKTLELLGQELAKLHQIAAPDYLPLRITYGIEEWKDVKKYAANSKFEKWLEAITEYIRPYLELDLPKTFIHSDLFCDNVIVSKDGSIATIMDFEESAKYYRVFDIGMTIIGVCSKDKIVNLQKAIFFLNAYMSELRLSEKELSSLKAYTIYAGASMTFWRHRNFNYVKPDPNKFDHYKGLKVLVDYLLSLPEDCFTKLIDKKA